MTTVLDRCIAKLNRAGFQVSPIRPPRGGRRFSVHLPSGAERRMTPEGLIYEAEPAWKEIDRKMRNIAP